MQLNFSKLLTQLYRGHQKILGMTSSEIADFAKRIFSRTPTFRKPLYYGRLCGQSNVRVRPTRASSHFTPNRAMVFTFHSKRNTHTCLLSYRNFLFLNLECARVHSIFPLTLVRKKFFRDLFSSERNR